MTTVATPRRTRAILALAGALAGPLVPQATAGAQFAIDRTELSLNPADSTRRGGTLVVRNEGAVRAQATIRIEDWDRAEDGTNRFYAVGTLPRSCGAALAVFPLTLGLGPGESQNVRVDLAPGAPAGTGECWAVVLVEAATPTTAAGGRTLLYRLRTGLKVYVEPPGLVAEGQVVDVRISPSTTGSEVEVAFQNTGGRHLVARGRLEFRRPDNVSAVVVELPLAYALPDATARVHAAAPKLPPGHYIVLATMDYGGSEIAAAQLEHEVR